jgi:hypothetical protein
MKKIIVILALCFITHESFGQHIPDSILKSFYSIYPTVKKIRWESMDSVNYYALFRYDKIYQIVKFDSIGNTIEIIQELTSERYINPAVRKSLDDKYPKYEVFEIIRIKTDNIIFYQLILDDGHNEIMVQMLENGTLLLKMGINEVIRTEKDRDTNKANKKKTKVKAYSNKIKHEW